MSDRSITEFFTDQELANPIELVPMMGPALIYEHNLDVNKFTGKICGVGALQLNKITDTLKVISYSGHSHDSLWNAYRNYCEYYHDENPTKPRLPLMELHTTYGFITDNGYFLTRYQACDVGIKTNQTNVTFTRPIKSYEVRNWAKSPFAQSEFELKL